MRCVRKFRGRGKNSAQVCSMCANPWCSCGMKNRRVASGRGGEGGREEGDTVLRNVRVSLYFGAAVNSLTDFVNARAATSERTNEWASERAAIFPSRARSLRRPIRGQGHARRPIFEMTHRRVRVHAEERERERPRGSKVKIQKYKEETEKEEAGRREKTRLHFPRKCKHSARRGAWTSFPSPPR